MKKAFWYNEEELELIVPDYEEEDFSLDEDLFCEPENWENYSVTENGAVGYGTTGHALLDLNFMVSSLRVRSETLIVKEFAKAYYESPEYAVKWLFFLRDIQEGLGERRSFRVCMKYLAESHPDLAGAVMELIPEYGRYDDLLLFLDTGLKAKVCSCLKTRLEEDLLAMEEQRPVSLLAKWLPSINTSSGETRRLAGILARELGMNCRTYRKTLSALRSYGNVLEVKLSASRWDEIDYETVPAKANMKYENAFLRHDSERRTEYLMKVFEGREKLNGSGIMPYEVVHRFLKNSFQGGRYGVKDDLLAELMWKYVLEQGFRNDWGLDDCIVVADGSASMYDWAVRSGTVMAIEVCDSLAIYFAEQLKGVFHNKVITFSGRPRFIDLDKGKSLKEKLEILLAYNEVSNTNIEAVFELLLAQAVSSGASQEELPGQVLIISDMEFDMASKPNYGVRGKKEWKAITPALFQTLEQRYETAGYKMPRLIFWNVCGRTDTVPKIENENGIVLLSGFSQNAAKIAADRDEKDPYESLLGVLDGPRYRKVGEAVAGAAS